jgi:hypothetical protein
MKILALLLTALALAATAAAEDSRKTLASTMDVFVFPAEGQDTEQQSKDEVACYEWAVGNTGSDPFDLAKQEQSDAQKAQAEKEAAKRAGQGAGAGGVIAGAATGALIGEIANDDASDGAAWGAAAGLIRGRRKSREAQYSAEKKASSKAEQREQATSEQLGNFKKAFSVCLEAKEYMVKY